MSVQDLGQITI